MKHFNKYKDAFLTEARAHLETMNTALLKLEQSHSDPQYFHEIFRSVHTLKSMAAAMDFSKCATLCHTIEDILDGIRHHTIQLDTCVDVFFECFDFIKSDLKHIEQQNEELDTTWLIEKLDFFLQPEKISKKLTGIRYKKENSFSNIEKIQSVDIKVDKLDALVNLVENLIVNKMKLELLQDQYTNAELTTTVESLSRIVSELQYNVMQLRMVSISLIFNQFPRIVRDLSKLQNKKINLIIEGDDIEVDRTLVDVMSEALLHLVRNAIDHGLESTEERLKNNKSEYGVIKLSAERTKEYVLIKVSDDGAGLNFEKIKKKAVTLGLLAPTATEEEVKNIIFSEISTAQEITEISGRGLGLNIVKEKVEAIGGSIQVKSIQHQGAIFTLHIPLSLAVVNSLFVKIAERTYAIPVNHINRLVSLNNVDMKTVLNEETIILDSEDVPIINLTEIFGEKSNLSRKHSIVVVENESERLGIAIDEPLKTEEIVVKPLSSSIRENKYFSGSAIVGSGEMILILDTANLFLLRSDSIENRMIS